MAAVSNALELALANIYKLKSKYVEVSHGTAGVLGGPNLTYKDQTQEHDFGPDQLSIQDTEIGQLVTAVLEVVPDLRTVTFTLVVPPVRVPAFNESTPVKLVGIVTTTHTTIAGPGPGAEKTYEVIYLEGKAEAIVS